MHSRLGKPLTREERAETSAAALVNSLFQYSKYFDIINCQKLISIRFDIKKLSKTYFRPSQNGI